MLRSNWVLSGLVALSLGSACSDDDSSGDESAAGNAGSGGGSAGSGSLGNGGDAGSAGSMAGSAGLGGGEGATYSVAEACERFAQVTCAKGEECGLLVPVAVPICLTCSAFAVQTIATACEGDLSGPQNAADVDRCLAGIAANSCAVACSDAPFTDCEAFESLPNTGAAVECDPQCL